MRIGVNVSGDWHETRAWLGRLRNEQLYADLDRYGQMGVDALMSSTPVRTGRAAISWHYRILRTRKHIAIEWYSTDEDRNLTPVAILLQYGHATGTGGYVRGRDFINPAMKPVFDQIANDVWLKATS